VPNLEISPSILSIILGDILAVTESPLYCMMALSDMENAFIERLTAMKLRKDSNRSKIFAIVKKIQFYLGLAEHLGCVGDLEHLHSSLLPLIK
jgi:hypothetical protein